MVGSCLTKGMAKICFLADRFVGKGHFLRRYATLRSRGRSLRCVSPNYAFIEQFKGGDVLVDVGTGSYPDFSMYMRVEYGLTCFAVEPTRRHASALARIQEELPTFHHLPIVLGPETGTALFHESQVNESGSLLPGHRNIVNDPTVSYSVKTVTLSDLLRLLPSPRVAVLKMDIEGAEYGVLQSVDQDTIQHIPQLIVEFHHGIVSGITWQNTAAAIRRLESFGMQSLVYNGRDCLFYW